MSHEITPDNEHLELLHSDITSAIEKVITQTNPFKYREGIATLGLDCITVAREVYEQLSSSRIANLDDIVKGRLGEFETFSVYPLADKKLADAVTKIYAKLVDHIDNIPSPLLTSLLKTCAEMDDKDKNNIFSISPNFLPFKNKQGTLQPVSTADKKSESGSDKLFRAHLCKVSMTARGKVDDDLQHAVYNYYENLVQGNQEITEKEEALSEIQRQINQLFDDPDNRALIGLRELLDKETSGLVRREAGVAYLEYLLDNAKKQSLPCTELEKIVTNIRSVESYIHHSDRSNADCQYQVTDEHTCDLRELLGNADAFTNLPVIGLIEGNLEERTSPQERVFVFGIRFKANNPVTTPDRDFPNLLKSGMSVYARHLAKAIAVLKLAKQFNTGGGNINTDYRPLRLLGRSIKTVFLYYRVFSGSADKTAVWQAIASKLHARDPNALDELLKLADTMLKAEQKMSEKIISPAVVTLKNLLETKKACIPSNLKRCIVLEKQLVNDDILDASEGNLFIKELQKSARQDMNSLKKCLRYVRLLKKADIPADALYSMPFDLSFYDTFFYANRQERRSLHIRTQPQMWHFLPVLVRPQIPSGEKRDDYHKPLTKMAGVMVQIMPDIKPNKTNTFEFFVYKITVAIVFLLGLSALCQKLSQGIHLAIPIVRVHKAAENDPIEEYLNAVCATITFLLNEKYTAGMQGIQLMNLNWNQQKSLQYKITNARSSLYAFLPKTFSAPGFAPAFDKLAIVIVTSRVAGKHRYQDENYSLVNLFGRVVLLERLDQETLQLSSHFLTFAENDYKHEIHNHPKMLIDTVHRLYDDYGIRDILYIAKAPFTSNLNLTQKNPQPALYFMSETVLQEMMNNRPDLNIYPAFYGKYPAKMFGGSQLNAIYIDDVPSIQKHLQMDRKSESQIVTFLNIANGIKVKGKEAEKNFFNNVMSYATLDNIYSDRTLQSRILERMIAPDTAERKTLIDYICLLHAAAYEKADNELTLKLNPYQDILEDDNVNSISTFSASPKGKPDFNLFAFLTKIQRVINLIEKHSS